jgi:hypothetical protein
MIQFDDWPDMAVNVVNIVITPVITSSDSQLVAGEWSLRCDLPIPVREDTVELRVRPTELQVNMPETGLLAPLS